MDLDDVLRMFRALTRISQIEASTQANALRTLDLSLVAKEVAELFDAAAEERGSHLEVAGMEPIEIFGDRDLLFDAISNLVDNAIKHGRTSGLVRISADACGLVVVTAGAALPPEGASNIPVATCARPPDGAAFRTSTAPIVQRPVPVPPLAVAVMVSVPPALF